jgi:hypothetical protein
MIKIKLGDMVEFPNGYFDTTYEYENGAQFTARKYIKFPDHSNLYGMVCGMICGARTKWGKVSSPNGEFCITDIERSNPIKTYLVAMNMRSTVQVPAELVTLSANIEEETPF